MTRQEMFDRAVRGLRSQGFRRSDDGVYCQYHIVDGAGERRCAWGWVDPQGTAGRNGTVLDLHRRGEGLANELSDPDLHWARELQGVHDLRTADGTGTMEERLRCFGEIYGLEWPS